MLSTNMAWKPTFTRRSGLQGNYKTLLQQNWWIQHRFPMLLAIIFNFCILASVAFLLLLCPLGPSKKIYASSFFAFYLFYDCSHVSSLSPSLAGSRPLSVTSRSISYTAGWLAHTPWLLNFDIYFIIHHYKEESKCQALQSGWWLKHWFPQHLLFISIPKTSLWFDMMEFIRLIASRDACHEFMIFVGSHPNDVMNSLMPCSTCGINEGWTTTIFLGVWSNG